MTPIPKESILQKLQSVTSNVARARAQRKPRSSRKSIDEKAILISPDKGEETLPGMKRTHPEDIDAMDIDGDAHMRPSNHDRLQVEELGGDDADLPRISSELKRRRGFTLTQFVKHPRVPKITRPRPPVTPKARSIIAGIPSAHPIPPLKYLWLFIRRPN